MKKLIKNFKNTAQLKKLLCGAISGLCNGLFGSGGGVIAVFALERLLSLPPEKSHACALCVMLPLTSVSLILYIIGSKISFNVALYVAPSFFIGSIIGAKVFSKISNNFLNNLFIALTILGAIFMLVL